MISLIITDDLRYHRYMHDGITILYRDLAGTWSEEESAAASKYFHVTDLLGRVPPGNLVIPRYSALPFYGSMVRELRLRGARPVNTWTEHSYVADILEWYPDLAAVTPRTFRSLYEAESCRYGGPFVVKGRTNSRKFLWDTHMYADDVSAATAVWHRLMDDSLLGDQGTVFREYVPLRSLGTGLHGIPIAEEHRFFFLRGHVLVGGFYWANHVGDIEDVGTDVPDPRDVPRRLLEQISDIVTPRCPFFVADVARTETGDWIVVELNDGQMSGLSCCEPETLYRNMVSVLLSGKSDWFREP